MFLAGFYLHYKRNYYVSLTFIKETYFFARKTETNSNVLDITRLYRHGTNPKVP